MTIRASYSTVNAAHVLDWLIITGAAIVVPVVDADVELLF